MKDYNAILDKWEAQTGDSKNTSAKDMIVLYGGYLLLGLSAFFLVLLVHYANIIYSYAVAQQLPVTTVLLRLGKIDLSIGASIILLAVALFLSWKFNKYIFNFRKLLVTLVVAFGIIGVAGTFSTPVTSRFQAAINKVTTPLGGYFIAQAEAEMKQAKVEMGVITNVIVVREGVYLVTLRTSGVSETFVMEAEAIPPVNTSIWVAYSSEANEKKMQRMGVLPDGLL